MKITLLLYEQIQHMALNTDNPANDQAINLWIITSSCIWTKRQNRSTNLKPAWNDMKEYDDAGRFIYTPFHDSLRCFNYTVRYIGY